MLITTSDLHVGDRLADGWTVAAITRHAGGSAHVILAAPEWMPLRRAGIWRRRMVRRTIACTATPAVRWDVAASQSVWA